jgi:hypothetical protein
MLMAIVADAVFCAAVFAETLALISIFQTAYGLQLNEAFIPVMRAYHEKMAPLAGLGENFGAPAWTGDASLIAAAMFFSFFIAQARNAMAPYDDGQGPLYKPARLEAAIDFILPASLCAIGAALTAPTLLPFLTLPVALWLLLKRLTGKPGWFEVSPSYYVNAVFLAGVAASLFALAR